jgi:hypothetical protein
MKPILILVTALSFYFIFISCRNHANVSNNLSELECLEKFNTKLDSLFYNNCSDYSLIKGENIKFFVKIPYNKPLTFNSLVVLKSNLSKFKIDENSVINGLKKIKIECLNNIYKDVMGDNFIIQYSKKYSKYKFN